MQQWGVLNPCGRVEVEEETEVVVTVLGEQELVAAVVSSWLWLRNGCDKYFVIRNVTCVYRSQARVVIQ